MSALPLKADIDPPHRNVCFGPIADIETRGPILAHFLPQRDLIPTYTFIFSTNDHARAKRCRQR
jgi:hypothetical protein